LTRSTRTNEPERKIKRTSRTKHVEKKMRVDLEEGEMGSAVNKSAVLNHPGRIKKNSTIILNQNCRL